MVQKHGTAALQNLQKAPVWFPRVDFKVRTASLDFLPSHTLLKQHLGFFHILAAFRINLEFCYGWQRRSR